MTRNRMHLTTEVAIYVLVALVMALFALGDPFTDTPSGAPGDPCRGQRPGVCSGPVTP